MWRSSVARALDVGADREAVRLVRDRDRRPAPGPPRRAPRWRRRPGRRVIVAVRRAHPGDATRRRRATTSPSVSNRTSAPAAAAASISAASSLRRGHTAPWLGKRLPGLPHGSSRTCLPAIMRSPSMWWAPSSGMPSSSSAATARGVSPSPQTLSRPCGPFSSTTTGRPAGRHASPPPRRRAHRRSPRCRSAHSSPPIQSEAGPSCSAMR